MIAPTSSNGTGPSRLDVLAALVMFPAVVGHELTHALVAWPWVSTEHPRDLVDRVVPPRLELRYPSGTPVAVVVTANLAPTIVGLALGPVVVPWALSFSLPVAAYLVGAWALYTRPSGDDLAVLSTLF